MDRFLQAYGLPRLNQAYINNIDRSTAVNKAKTVIRSILTKKIPEPGAVIADFFHSLKKSL